ncbi:MAG: TetR/AcrR family transcriptional regulator [Acidobacteria bacterium]|nr:TetR/AcrR family transcriptional regulator [Acidobacteriota bacterium]
MTKRQEEILDNAMKLMVNEGITGLTMKKVADRMKFSEPALYRHFLGKQDMVVALISRIRRRYEEMIPEVDSTLPPREYFRELLCPLLSYLEQVKGIPILFLSESTFNRDDVVRQALFDLYSGMVKRISNYLEDAAEKGLIRKDVDPEAGAVMLVGMVQSLTIRFLLSAGELKLTEKCDDILNIFLGGILA